MRTVVYGKNPVRELIRAGRRGVHHVMALPDVSREPWLGDVTVRSADRAALGREAGTSDHQGVVAVVDAYPYADAAEILERTGPVLCLDRLQDPRNLGAVARVVEAVGAAGIILPDRGSPDVTGAVCKTSAGAIEHVHLARVENLASFLHDARGAERWVYGADLTGDAEDFRVAGLDGNSIVVVGAEGEGLRRRVASMCDRIVRIPMLGRVQSLNLSVSAALLLYETVRAQ